MLPDHYQTEPRLVAALAALDRCDYTVAIAALESIRNEYGLKSWGITAHMYLVKVYDETAQWDRALTLCNLLRESSYPQVQSWGAKAFSRLQQKKQVSGHLPPPLEPLPIPTSPQQQAPPANYPLLPSNRWQLWLIQISCLGALALVGVWGLLFILVGPILSQLRMWYDLSSLGTPIAGLVIAFTGLVVGIGYPWAWVGWLRRCCQLQPLSLTTLNRYSPKSLEVWGRFSWSWRQPQLALLPTATPLIFSFGHGIRRVILSEGLLTTLSDSSIAVLLTSELLQLRQQHNLLLGPVFFIYQSLYALYRLGARQSNKQADRLEQMTLQAKGKPDWGVLLLHQLLYRAYCGATVMVYAVLWLLKKIMAPANRTRLHHADRITVNQTKDALSLSQALVEITEHIAATVQQQQTYPHELEQYCLALPVEPSAATTFGGLQFGSQLRDWDKITAWERLNPIKDWFSLLSSHPFLGTRLQALSGYAQKLRQQPYLQSAASLRVPQRQHPWRQLTPVWGLVVGIVLALIAWRLGAFAVSSGRIGMPMWWFSNLSLMLWGWGSLGLALGILVRINAYYPVIKEPITDAMGLKPLLENPTALPLDSVPLKLTGKLLFTGGLENCWGQRLWLQTPVGLFKLQAWGYWGPFSHGFRRGFQAWENQEIEVQGWWRRGEVPWIEVDQARRLDKLGDRFMGCAPQWTTAFVVALVFFSLYTFLLSS